MAHERFVRALARNNIGLTLGNELRYAGLITEPLVVSPRLVVVDADKFDAEIAGVFARAAAHPRKLKGLIADARKAKEVGAAKDAA